MNGYEYKVIPAPAKGLKARGIKGPDARFAHALETRMNALAAEGWEYLRADILPSEERQGLTSTQTVYRSVLVFRRDVELGDAIAAPVDAASGEAELDAEEADDLTEDEAAENSDETGDTEAEGGDDPGIESGEGSDEAGGDAGDEKDTSAKP